MPMHTINHHREHRINNITDLCTSTRPKKLCKHRRQFCKSLQEIFVRSLPGIKKKPSFQLTDISITATAPFCRNPNGNSGIHEPVGSFRSRSTCRMLRDTNLWVRSFSGVMLLRGRLSQSLFLRKSNYRCPPRTRSKILRRYR